MNGKRERHSYLMESPEEILRLETKTDDAVVARQALWAGLESGMRVADMGCGTGKTTRCLWEISQPAGSAVGIDISAERIAYAQERYGKPGLEFRCRDILSPLDDLGAFDFVWLRFVLEYHRSTAAALVRNSARLVRPGGILCLVDLDYNCMNHFGLTPRLEEAINGVIRALEATRDFDPYAGRKLYSYLYDLGYCDIDVGISGHHLIFAELNETDAFNWMKKVEIAAEKSGYPFPEYQRGKEGFVEEFREFFTDPRRFTYTPVIYCRGRKPAD